MKSLTLLATVFILSSHASASFNLNTSGPDWDYPASDLANTTSQTCKDAYSANIDCDSTLVGLVASMRPGFVATSSDLAQTCSSTCKASFDAYVAGVTAACTKPGDKAMVSLGGECCNYTTAPVQLVGQIFQYHFAIDCSKDSDGTYCYESETSGSEVWNSPSYVCSDECAATFYQAAHDFPSSGWEFNYYFLIAQSQWWINQFSLGYAALQQCTATLTNEPGPYPTSYSAGGYYTDGSTTTCTDDSAPSYTNTASYFSGLTYSNADRSQATVPTFTLSASQTLAVTSAPGTNPINTSEGWQAWPSSYSGLLAMAVIISSTFV
ncbi:hypothetical protein MMC13_006249 [Lambiella insularis]|nr:hypothetical protein [Lambiella insularis]